MQHHVIQVETLEVSAPSPAAAREAMDSVEAIHDATVLPMLDGIFSSLVDDDEVVRLDRLVVDVGVIAPERLRAGLAGRLEERLRFLLPPLLEQARSEIGTDGARPTGALGAIDQFIETGLLPWYAPAEVRADPERAFRDLVVAEPAAVERLLRRSTPRALDRLVAQFSPETVRLAIELLAPGAADTVIEAIEGWVRLAAAAGSAPSRREATTQALAWIAVAPRPPSVPDLLDHLAAVVAPGVLPVSEPLRSARDTGPDLPPSVRAWAAERGIVVGSEDDPAATVPAPAAAESGADDGGPSGAPTALPDAPASSPDAVGPRDVAVSDDTVTAPGEEGDGPTPVRDEGRDDETPARAEDTVAPDLRDASREPTLHAMPEASPAVPDVAPDEPALAELLAVTPAGADEPGDAVYIENAGLVLLWPFLAAFFDEVGLVDSGGFRDDAACERAVQLLHHVAHGSTQCPEHQLLLNKLLCGWPVEETVGAELSPTDVERGAVDELLVSVIESWGALGSTSVEGLRTTFLQRAGRLARHELGWTLFVPREAFDVLLDRLPWGVGVIALPWMSEPLVVEW